MSQPSQIPGLAAIKLFADGADLESIIKPSRDPHIKGFTTNPTLMRKAGISDYAEFAREVLEGIRDRPISFEVFADDFAGMRRQARGSPAGATTYTSRSRSRTRAASRRPTWSASWRRRA